MKQRWNLIRQQLPYLPQVLGWIWAAAPFETFAWITLLLLQAVLPVVSVFLTRSLVNALLLIPSAGTAHAWSDLLLLAAGQAIVFLLTGIFGSLQSLVTANQREKMLLYLNTRIYQTTSQLDLDFFESARYYDQLLRAAHDARGAPLDLLFNFGILFQHSITFLGIGGILFSYSWWLPLLLLLGVIPQALGSVLNYQRQNRWRKANTQNERRLFYYDWLLTMRRYAPEVRIYQMAESTIAAYRALQQKLSSERISLRRRELFTNQFASLASLVVLGGITAWAILGNLAGSILLGDLALFWQSAQKGRSLFSGMLTALGQIYRNLLYLQDIHELLEQRPQIEEPEAPKPVPTPIKTGVVIDQVSFQYPAHQKPVFDKLSLTLPAKQITALVGVNGAGKSTLIKLLCRFYDPDEGSIRVDGIDIREFSPRAYQQQISALMQSPAQFYTSVENNITVGRASGGQTALRSAAEAAGAHAFIEQLPEGYQTMLGNMFDGTDLSGGEWLRIALARAFYCNCSLLLLDEPTEGMDSWAEMAWFAHFREVAREKTSLIITHRFTTAMQADRIHLLANGRIIESGSHHELLALKGRYAESWQQQMRLEEKYQS